jgi:hypothetical protein
MKELREYRTGLIKQLVNSAREFRRECLAAKDAFAPLEANGWNIHQIAIHTRDINLLVYGSRIRRTASETNPEFQNFNGEAYMTEHYSASEPLGDVLDGFVEQVESLAEMLRELPSEAWSRESRHMMLGGGLTLQSWVEKGLAHIEEHLGTIKEQKGS